MDGKWNKESNIDWSMTINELYKFVKASEALLKEYETKVPEEFSRRFSLYVDMLIYFAMKSVKQKLSETSYDDDYNGLAEKVYDMLNTNFLYETD